MFNNAIGLIVNTVVNHPNTHNKYRSDAILDEVRKGENLQIVENICTPILLHQFQQSNNDIWISYDNFLCAHGLSYAHEMRGMVGNFSPHLLIYFLTNVCRREIFESSYLFENQDQLDNERIEICLLLTEIDPANSTRYISEISDISRNILIRQGIKQIDESKIFVDVNGIKRSLEKELRESFNRSLELMSIPLDQIEKLFEGSPNVVIPYYGKSESKADPNAIDNIKLASFTRYELFKDMFYKVRDKFISSNEYGIETYLSMRIRHGTLLGEIRSVFENLYVITKKESTDGTYEKNEYWLDKFSFLSKEQSVAFSKLMSSFSFEIDRISEELKNKWLQIRTEKKSTEGLFNYTYKDDNLIKIFKHKVAGIENYDDFINTLIDELWDRTEQNLVTIRLHILNTVKQAVINQITELINRLENLISKYQHSELNELIRNLTECQTAIAVDFEKIAQWFQRTNNQTINDFFIDLPLDASLTTIRRIYPKYSSFSPKIRKVSTTRFDGEYFTRFADLLQILLDNIIKHSQLDPYDVNCNIEIIEDNGRMNLMLINSISSSVDLEQLNRRINESKRLIALDIDTEITRNEGGSGYLKIKKILKSDLARENFVIGLSEVDEKRTFTTTISFDTLNLEKALHEISNN